MKSTKITAQAWGRDSFFEEIAIFLEEIADFLEKVCIFATIIRN